MFAQPRQYFALLIYEFLKKEFEQNRFTVKKWKISSLTKVTGFQNFDELDQAREHLMISERDGHVSCEEVIAVTIST